VYSLPVFTGVNLFALKFYRDRVVPISHSHHQITRDTGPCDGEDHIPLRSLVWAQYWSVTDKWNGFAVAYTALAKLALWHSNYQLHTVLLPLLLTDTTL